MNKFKHYINFFVFSAIILIIVFVLTIILKQNFKDAIIFSFSSFIISLISMAIYFKCFHKYFVFDESNFYLSNKEKELELLKTTEKYRREFIGNVSHELKTPIFNIQGYVETLIDGALYDKSVNKKYLSRASKSIDRLIYIIRDLETISQLESSELSLEISHWNLKDLINDQIDQFEVQSRKKHIKFIHDQKSTNIKVYADKGKIAQVLANLMSNSIKYGKKHGSTRIAMHQTKSSCSVIVRDTGIGIPEKHLNRLFDRFYRVDKSRSREQGGTGLGLAIVKHIIEAHNQNIYVKSTVGRGTEFLFTIQCSDCSNTN